VRTLTIDGVDVSYRDEGGGPAVILGHSSTGTSGQWRRWIAEMADRYRLLAPDFLGYGATPYTRFAEGPLRFDVDVLEALMDLTEGPVHLVGHSYGGSISARLALRRPERVRSLTVIEPTLFYLLKPAGEDAADREIRGVAKRASEYIDRGDVTEAARGFIDYWLAPGAFDRMKESTRLGILSGMAKLRDEFVTTFAPGNPDAAAFSTLPIPILIMRGAETTPAGSRVAEVFRSIVREPEFAEIEGAGHMCPVTHPETVNLILTDFVDRHAS
jgi:pimeloyl-ACP methyl ester carboxylesterase